MHPQELNVLDVNLWPQLIVAATALGKKHVEALHFQRQRQVLAERRKMVTG